jgi:putative YphP/YqiW family bacilliredoxin
MYPAELVQPMKDDLTNVGFKQLTSSEEVDQTIPNATGTMLVVVNSVCGCAAGNMRPGVKLSLKNDKVPTQLATVFAGVDGEATTQARNYFLPYPPSSPSIALFKDGKLVEKPMVTMYFNGKKVHKNQKISQVWGGPNSGQDGGNDGGKGISDRPGGLKLQAEGHNVYYRNIWIVPMDIKKAETDF